ncbi:MAG: hypothetical protein V4439_01265 [Patescibacteria group bacterium]
MGNFNQIDTGNMGMKGDPTPDLSVNKVAEDINNLLGSQDWVGSKPFEIETPDGSYKYQIRREENWITINEIPSATPEKVQSFFMEKKGDKWKCFNVSSMKDEKLASPELKATYERILNAKKSSK